MNGHSSRKTRAAKRPAAAPAPPAANDKRERILDAAVRVFAAEGFYNAKVALMRSMRSSNRLMSRSSLDLK
jgi:hypothetical protein